MQQAHPTEVFTVVYISFYLVLETAHIANFFHG